jgi:hypothetical protein
VELSEIWGQADAADSAQDILQHFLFVVSERLYSSDIESLAIAMHDELAKRIESASTPEEALTLARKARATFRAAAAEYQQKCVTNAIETEWEPGRRELMTWVEGGKVGPKPAWGCPTAAELSGSSSKSAAPVADDEEL